MMANVGRWGGAARPAAVRAPRVGEASAVDIIDRPQRGERHAVRVPDSGSQPAEGFVEDLEQEIRVGSRDAHGRGEADDLSAQPAFAEE